MPAALREHARPIAVLAAGAVALAAVWLARPVARPPLYDGIPITNQYRYVSPPPNYQNQPPQRAHAVVAATGASSPVIVVTTGDGQARLQLDGGALVMPADATSLTVDVVPVPAPAGAPALGQIDGNVYAVGVSAAGVPVGLAPGRRATVTLAATGDLTGESIQEYSAPTWQQLPTRDLGSFLFSAPLSRFGEVTLVGTGTATEGVASVAAVLVSGVVAIVLVVVGSLSMTRWSRRPPRPRPPP